MSDYTAAELAQLDQMAAQANTVIDDNLARIKLLLEDGEPPEIVANELGQMIGGVVAARGDDGIAMVVGVVAFALVRLARTETAMAA